MAQYKANVFVKDELREITNPEKDRPQRIICLLYTSRCV